MTFADASAFARETMLRMCPTLALPELHRWITILFVYHGGAIRLSGDQILSGEDDG